MTDKVFFIIVLAMVLIFIWLLALVFQEAITEYIKTRMYERQYKVRKPLLDKLTKTDASDKDL